MKVFYVAQVRFPTEKAHGIQIAKVCSSLSRSGHDVELLVPQRANSIAEDAFGYYSIPRNFNITYIQTRVSSRRAIGFFLEGFEFLWKARTRIKKETDAAVYSRDLLSPLFFRSVVEIHNLPRGIRFLYSLAWKRVKALVVKTSFLKEDIARDYGISSEKMSVIPNGIDVEDFSLDLAKEDARKRVGWKADDKIALYTGSFYGWKGVDVLLAAARKEKEIIFVFIGGSEKDVKEKKALYPELNLFFLGQKPHKDIPLYLRAADALILPNKKGEDVSERYTSPLKLFEYMASGTPIVASRLPSIEEIVGENEAYLFEPNDPDSLLKRLREAISSPEESLRRTARAKSKASTLTWDEYARKIAILLKS